MTPAPLALAAALLGAAAPAAAETVNVYSARHDSLIEPLLERFTEETGIEVGLITGSSDAMIKRLEVEGRNSPADVLITVDAARLHRAEESGLFQPVRSEALGEALAPHLQDDEDLWFGLSMRARVIAFSRERVERSELSTYEALAEPKWDGRICIRSSDNVYNQSLLASLVAAHGVEQAEDWARGIVENMARPPQGGDTDQIEALAAGICDVAVVNTYYYARMLESDDPGVRAVADEVGLFFPNQDGRGAHVNVTGAGVLEHAPNRDNAVRLLEYLVTPEAQRWLARVNHEYPVRPGIEVSDTVRQLGRYPFKQDRVSLGRIGELNAEAVRIFDRVDWR
ncbi:MAG: Fe(3+) ABC transporter substrate-binding protein [Halofilum sp. (in: g-proteobacteria)]|nr:Fe(3+) ABC transporter substrate-binding protein [Halofilum sp. (in: g-proteobacteria)]